jgi:hypothetical protein
VTKNMFPLHHHHIPNDWIHMRRPVIACNCKLKHLLKSPNYLGLMNESLTIRYVAFDQFPH